MCDQDCTNDGANVPEEHWMNSKWRPMMGWMYMLVCTMDFIGFPILWSILQAYAHGQVNSQWQPLTLQGAGLFHIAMGAVLGIAAYGRTREKLVGADSGGLGTGVGTTYTVPAPMPTPAPAPISPTPAPAPVVFSSTGKAMPAPADTPSL